MMELLDDKSNDDYPNVESEIAGGFYKEHPTTGELTSYYYGNDWLEAATLDEVQVISVACNAPKRVTVAAQPSKG